MPRGRALLITLSLTTAVLAAGLAYTYRIYTLTEDNRRLQSEALNSTIEALERTNEARLRERIAHSKLQDDTQRLHRTVAAAYRSEATRMLRRGRRLAARIFTAAALLHDPDNPLSPYRVTQRGPAPPLPFTPEQRASIAASQSALYETAVRGVLHHQHSVDKLGFRVWSVTFSPDGKLLAVCGDSRRIRIWDLAKRRWARDLVAPAMPVFDVAFSPDGKRLAAATNAGKVRIWDMASGKAIHTLNAHHSMALTVGFSPKGRLLATGGMDRQIRIFDATTFAPRGELRQAQGAVWSLSFSPDGKLLASAAWHQARSRIRIWSLMDRRPHANYTGHLGPVWAVAFSPDGQHLVSGGLDRTIRVFTARKLRLQATLKHHRADVTSLAFSPDGRWLVSASIDKSFALWRTDRWQRVTSVRAHGRQLWTAAFSPKGNLLATGGWDRRVRIWRLGHGPLRPHLLRPATAQASPFVGAWYTKSGDRVVARDSDNVFHVWDLASKRPVARRRLLPADLHPVALSGDGLHVVTTGPRNEIWVWPLHTKERARVLRGPTSQVTGVALAPDGATVAAASAAGTVRILSVADRKELDRVEKVRAPLAFSTDGKLLATSDGKRGVRLLRVQNLESLRSLPGDDSTVERLLFGPRGERLLAVRDDQTMVLWDPRTGKRLHHLTGHTDEIVSACFSADGRYVLSTSRDRTVRIWRTQSGLELQRLALPRVVRHAAFAPDGKHFAVPTPQGVSLYPVRLQLWRKDPRKLLERAQRAAGLRLDGFRLRPAD